LRGFLAFTALYSSIATSLIGRILAIRSSDMVPISM